MKLKSGSLVKLSDHIEVDWVEKPNHIEIEEVLELSESWVVAKVNGVYRHTDGSTSSYILIENLEIDIMENRNRDIDNLLDSE